VIIFYAGLAFAGDCPTIPDQVERAYAAFNDAETEQAREVIAGAYESLSCQQDRVPPEALMSLYHLDALMAFSAEDSQGAVYAIIRSIAADPAVVPPKSMGPELAEMHKTWSGRLADAQLTVSKEARDVSFWIDGRVLEPGVSMVVVEGEHLLQMQDATGFHSSVVEVSSKISDQEPWNLQVAPREEIPVVPVVPVATTMDVPKSPASREKRRRRARLGVGLAGVVVAVSGGGVLALGAMEESAFKKRNYNADQYGGCTRTDDCYVSARESEIRADARMSNQLYLTGYGLIGLGAATTSIGVFAFPVSDGGGIGLRAPW
jgi:hypothetical protein